MRAPEDLGPHKVSEPLGFLESRVQIQDDQERMVQRSDHTEAVQDHDRCPA